MQSISKNVKQTLNENKPINEMYSDYHISNKFASLLNKKLLEIWQEFEASGMNADDEIECVKTLINFPIDQLIFEEENENMYYTIKLCFDKIKNY